MERTDRILLSISALRVKLDSMRRGKLVVSFANGTLAIQVIEFIEESVLAPEAGQRERQPPT